MVERGGRFAVSVFSGGGAVCSCSTVAATAAEEVERFVGLEPGSAVKVRQVQAGSAASSIISKVVGRRARAWPEVGG